MEGKFTLIELLHILRKRLSLILSITFIAIFISGIVSYFIITPTYQASTQLLVNQSKDGETAYQYNEVQTNLQLINTYNVIIKSPAILDLVIKDLKLDMSVSELNEKITVQKESDSQVVSLSVSDIDAANAAKIANKTADIFKEEIVKIMNVNNVSILAEATVSEDPTPITPKPLINIIAAMLIGLMAGVGLAYVLEFFDNTVKDEQEIEKLIGVPVLGSIALMDGTQLKGDKNRRAGRNAKLRGETIGS